MKTLSDRLKARMEEAGLNQEDLADKANTSQTTISNILNDVTKKPRNIIEIANVLEVDPIWLLTGKGKAPSTALVVAEENGQDVVLDVLAVEASAGDGAMGGDMIEIVRQVRYAPLQFHSLFAGINPKNIRVISAKGDSMYPTIEFGALLFVDISVNHFDGDGVYIFNYDNYNYVKRLQKAGKVLRVISDNKDLYPKDWEITGEEINQLYIFGKVKAVQNQSLDFIG